MAHRIVLSINAECDIHVQRTGPDTVRVRITEKGPELLQPTDFEIEGDAAAIAQALGITASVLGNLDSLLKQDPA
jgi:hypothetical protein